MIAIGALALVVAAAGVLWARQRRGAVGGAISLPKLVWLALAVYAWFFLAPIVAWEVKPFRVVLGTFAGFMWVRGVTELVMMYGTKSWRPVYGIAHDVSALVLLLGTTFYFRPDDTQHTRTFVVFLAATLLLETYYAYAFRGEHTTGDDAVWFASPYEPRFARINQVTALCNVPLIIYLLWFLSVRLDG